MSQHDPITNQNTPDQGDGKADAFAAVAIIALVVSAVAYWLKHM